MLVSDIQRRVTRIFGDASGVQVTLPDILDWVNDGQTDICRKAECLEGIQTVNLVAGTEAYAYPADFIKEQKVMVSGLNLARLTMAAIEILYPDRAVTSTRGNSLYYFHRNRSIVIYPIPASAVTGGLVVWYIKDAVDVTIAGDTPEVPVIFHEDLVRYCLWRASELDEDRTAARDYADSYNAKLMETIYDSNTKQSEMYPAVSLCPGD